MRVVTCDTGQLRVLCSPPTLAFLQAISRKSQCENARNSAERDIDRSAMTGAAEINRVNRREASRICDQRGDGFVVIHVHLGDMLSAGPMACFASDAGRQGILVEAIVGGRSG